MATIAEILKSKITKNGKSKTYVATELGVTEKTIENYMNGKREPDATALVRLSQILEFSLNELSEQNVPKSIITNKNNEPLNTKKVKSDAYLALLESNDRFFKNEYAQMLISLNKLIDLGMKQEALIKLNLQHMGVVEALQKGADVDEIQAQINSQISEIGPYGQKDNDDDN